MPCPVKAMHLVRCLLRFLAVQMHVTSVHEIGAADYAGGRFSTRGLLRKLKEMHLEM